ncbi:MAG: DUF4157 domain-containing protein [Nostocales cyanobacterium 94392]|nr:DUF4157 domain-containing protein [Nostocales cyanobacterium 94392]
MAESHSTATPETTKAISTAQSPLHDFNTTAEIESNSNLVTSDRLMMSVGGSPETPPSQFAGALGQLGGAAQVGMLRQLQRGYGNNYVGKVIQAKLTVGQAGDVYEQEADRVADQIMRMPESDSISGVNVSEQIQPVRIQRMCTECEEEEQIHRKEGGGPTPTVTPALESRLNTTKGSGEPLPQWVRSRMEPRFGADFAGVRVHRGSEASTLNRELGAQAFTRQRDIYFGAGRYQPDTREGQRLLAHELTHVVQQESNNYVHTQVSDQIQRYCETSEACLAELTTNKAQLRRAIQGALKDSLQDDSNFVNELISAALDVFPDDAVTEVENRAQIVASMTAPHNGTEIGLTTALRNVQNLLTTEIPVDLQGVRSSYSVAYLIQGISTDIATYFLGALNNAPIEVTDAASNAREGLRIHLERTIAATENPSNLLSLELEATIIALFDQRTAFALTGERPKRSTIGRQIGQLARRTMLLNQALLNIQTRATGEATPLDQEIIQAAAQIAHIRQIAQQERDTREALGDDITLLAQQQIDVEDPVFADHSPSSEIGISINPQEALPEASDTAANQFMRSLQRRVQSQQTELSSLRGAILPISPSYELPEFTTIFRRWFAFFSLAQEQQDPALRLYLDLMGASYQLMGSSLLEGPSAISGGIARAMMMQIFAEQMQSHLGGGINTQFSVGQRLTRSEEVSGRASSPRYEFAELFSRTRQERSLQGEITSRTIARENSEQDTSVRFSAVAGRPLLEQPMAAVEAGISSSLIPLVGLRQVEAQEGWSYLVDVYDPMSTDDVPVMREHKVMPSEITNYLMAYQQHVATLQQGHHPRVERRAIGEQVESSEANAVARYLEGEINPEPSREAQSLRGSLTEAREGAGISSSRDRPQELLQEATFRLIIDFERYFNDFYQQHQEAAYRLGSIFIIANVQFGVGQQLMNLLNPQTIADMLQQALQVSLITYSLRSLFGSVGRIAATSYESYLKSQGVSEVAALISIGAFLRNASQASNFQAARAWSYMVQHIVEDASELFESLVTTPLTQGFEHLTSQRPTSPRELADALRNTPIMHNQESRAVLLEGIEARIGELEAQGVGTSRSDPEYDALIHFRDHLLQRTSLQQSQLSSDVDMALPGSQERTAETDFFSSRTPEERSALSNALGNLAGQVPIIENPTLPGHTVRVRYDEGRVQIEVGPLANTSHIHAHLETVRQLRRYEGFVGTIRHLIARVRNHLRILGPDYGTRGHEARLEVNKLNAILADLEARQQSVQERAQRLNDDTSLAVNQAEQQAIAAEIESIQQQLIRHLQDINSYEQGRGFVAAEDTRRIIRTDEITAVPAGYLVQKVQLHDLNAPNYAPETVPQPPIVLEFPDGTRVWRDTPGGPIRHESTLRAGTGRQHLERGHYSASEYGRPTGPRYERSHTLGQGTGFESPYGIYDAPGYVNQTLQNNGIESYLRQMAAAPPPGTSYRVVTSTSPIYIGGLPTRRLGNMTYRVEVVINGEVHPFFEYTIQVSGSVDHPQITASPITFANNPIAQSHRQRVPMPDILRQTVNRTL